MGTLLQDQLTGRLADLLAAAAGTDVTWLVDGDTLEAASVLAAGAPAAAGAAASPPDATASAWLDRLKAQTVGSPVLALPYADPDVAAVVRAGLSDDLDTATSLGTDVTADVARPDRHRLRCGRWHGRPRAPPTERP